MELKELSVYKNIIIQCHDIPDADTITSGYALQRFLRSEGADARLVYGGRVAIVKPSLLLMLELNGIHIEHVQELPHDTDLLITVDCQRGAGNVQQFELPESARVVVIDHHRPEIPEGEDVIIRPYLGSCATLVWDMLRGTGFEMDYSVQNLLYYGLYTDTNGLNELRHPLDRDLADQPSDAGMIRRLKNSAITLDELEIIGNALNAREVIGNIGLFRAQPCDPNLLGFTSDIAQQVAQMDCCVVYCELTHGVKLSIRSSAREIMASEIAAFLSRNVGSGGGNIEKAGGFISFGKLAESGFTGSGAEYLMQRVAAYLDNYDMIYAGNNNIDFGAMRMYRKLPRPVGFAASADIFPAGSKITVRTLEGDVDTTVAEDIYLMIGIQGEVYPIRRAKFEGSYRVVDEPYREQAEYTPAIIDRITGERKLILPFAKTCVPKDTKLVRAQVLHKDTKVFTSWDLEKYFSGTTGDYLVANEGDSGDCYIVRGDIFGDTYEPVQ